MKRAFALLILVLAFTGSGARAEIGSGTPVASSSQGVEGFQTWKTSRIDEARTALEKIQADAQNR